VPAPGAEVALAQAQMENLDRRFGPVHREALLQLMPLGGLRLRKGSRGEVFLEIF
jgi:hypothetical protein